MTKPIMCAVSLHRDGGVNSMPGCGDLPETSGQFRVIILHGNFTNLERLTYTAYTRPSQSLGFAKFLSEFADWFTGAQMNKTTQVERHPFYLLDELQAK